jgi:hypothetical protein
MATFSLADARARVAARATGRGLARRAGLGTSVALCLAALVLLFSGGPPPPGLRVEQLAASREFPIVDWHLARIAERADRIGLGLLGARPRPTDADRSAAAAYFAARSADRAPLAPGAETAIERAVSTVLRQEGLDDRPAPWTADGEILFPPVSFAFTRPPEVLIVARRDRISVVQSELLRPGIADVDAERLEAEVDALGYSSLVTPIGGLATFPTMVVDTNRPLDAVVAVTHEWIHGYLFFTPLGARYWSSQDARTINETVADMVSRELGPRAVRELGLESPQSSGARPATPQPSMVQVRTMMRETRIQLDALLREGKVAEAEAYLRDRRPELVAAGFQIRKLNQAYFAFYGSYGDAAAGVNPIPRQLGWLRAASSSPGEFLRRVGQLTSAEDLARAVGE